jgi:hypothetical protein
MTAYDPRHVVPRDPEPGPLTQFFRRAIAAVRRRKAAPAGVAAGAAVPPADRFACCVHCVTEDVNECDPPGSHLAPCSYGCNGEAPRPHIPADRFATESLAWAELKVGEQWNAWHDDDVHARPHPATEPAGLPVLTPAQLAAHADAMHAASERYLPPPPRPVNGRSLPDQPRQSPVPWQELNRKFENGRPTLALLRQVAAGLRKVNTARVPVYGERPQLEVDKLYRNGWQ